MATIPKQLPFKLYFRKKTKTRKLLCRFRKLRQLSKTTNGVFLPMLKYKIVCQSFYTRIWSKLPKQDSFDECRNKVQLLNQSNDCYSTHSFLPNPNPNVVYFQTRVNYSVSSRRLLFGSYGICTVQYSTISAAYVETIKLDIAKILKKKGRVWTRICCDCPVSARPAETRMGKGKGSISHFHAKVSPGQILFEFSGVTKAQLDEIFQKLCKKTAIGLSIVS